MALVGRKALVKVSGTAIAFTDEATTANGDRTRYQVTNAVKRVWDRTVAIVVERDPTGGSGFSVVPASEYTLNRLKGTVIFAVAQAAAAVIRVDGSYLPMSTAAEAKAYTWEIIGENADAGIFGDTWMKRQQMRRDVRGSLSQWRGTDAFMETALLAGDTVVLQFYSDASLDPELSVWAVLNTQQLQAVVDGFVEQSVDFESATDADGRSVSYDVAVAVSGSPAGNDQLVTDLGGDAVIVAGYDVRAALTTSGGFVDAWGDWRGAGFGPDLTATGGDRPAWDGTTINGGGTARLASVASALFDLSGAKSIIVVAEFPAGAAANETLASICESSSVIRLLAIKQGTGGDDIGTVGSSPAYVFISSLVVGSANRRLILASKGATDGLAARIANQAEEAVTGSSAPAAGNNVLTLFDLFPGIGQYSASKIRAVLVLNRAYTSADFTTIRTWALAQHTIVDA